MTERVVFRQQNAETVRLDIAALRTNLLVLNAAAKRLAPICK